MNCVSVSSTGCVRHAFIFDTHLASYAADAHNRKRKCLHERPMLELSDLNHNSKSVDKV